MGSIAVATPSLAESKLFKPVKAGNVLLKHRVVLAPLTRYRNDEEHVPLEFMKRYYADRASVPGTLVISEATPVSHGDEGAANLPGFRSEEQIEGWSKIIDAVHAKGSPYFQQFFALGRASEPGYLASRGFGYKSSSAVRMDGVDTTPEAMVEEEIQEKIQDFVEASKNAIRAGADGVEIHGAHGYLIEQFISDSVNQRTDKWGGSVENRSRFLLEVVKAVVAAVGAERVAIRLSPFASFQGAQSSDIHGQYSYIIDELKKLDASFAYLSLVEVTGDPAAILFNGKEVNQDKTLDFILEAWGDLSPVVVAGGYSPESAARAVDEHYKRWDVLVAFGRHFLANPDLVFRIQHGIELNKYNRSTFYINKSEVGYNDYAFSEDFLISRGGVEKQ